MNSFGVKLRKLRIERGISISELADGIGYRRLTIYRWENGKTYPKNLDAIRSIADYFHISLNYFFNDESVEITKTELSKLHDEVSKLRAEVNILSKKAFNHD